jgi:hypothetical protein
VKIGRTIIAAFPRYADVRSDAIAARYDLDTWRTKRVEPGPVVYSVTALFESALRRDQDPRREELFIIEHFKRRIRHFLSNQQESIM